MRTSFTLSDPVGVEFEADLADVCIRHFAAKTACAGKKRRDFVIESGTDRDKFEGVDVEIYGVGIDFTYFFSGKDHMEVLPGLFSGRYTDIKFGVRTGNSHHGYTKFKTPVLVIGIDAETSYVRNWMANIIDDFEKNFEKIIDMAQDAYWGWMDLHPEYE